VESVDLARYMGVYEIALLPNRFQSMCVADTQASYRLDAMLSACGIAAATRMAY